ncbi:MAG: sporulation protein YunB [Eubacteriales bacterium]|nr:sporulation protein YunB [Eubacteriales bacterium]
MKKAVKKLLIVVIIIFVVIAAGFVYINANLRPVLAGLSAARVESVAAKAMNQAILDVISTDSAAQALLDVYSNDHGVYLLQANSGKLNTLSADCADAALERIMQLGEQGVSIPIGTVSGIPLFSGIGPKITLKFTPAGAVQTSFDSEFRSAGINQTLHRITLRLTATIRIILPGQSHTVTVVAEAAIAENIIVGDVPSAYTNVANEEDLLNLVPGVNDP